MIELREIHKTYTTRYEVLPVLKGVDLRVRRGELIAITGASGSGKSTLLNVLGLLDKFDAGEYLLEGKSVAELNDDQMAFFRNQKIGFVFQSANLIPQMDVLDNIILPLTYRKMSEKESRRKGEEMLERFDLLGWRRHYPYELSGGQRQRVAIGRAIITQPCLILADEPTGQLDSVTTQSVMDLLCEINRTAETTMVIVTHEQVVAERAKRIVCIKDGVLSN